MSNLNDMTFYAHHRSDEEIIKVNAIQMADDISNVLENLYADRRQGVLEAAKVFYKRLKT